MISDKPSSIDMKTVAASQPLSPHSLAKDKVNSPSVQQSSDSSNQIQEPRQIEAQASEKETVSAQQAAQQRNDEVKQKVNEAIPKVRELLQKNQRSLDFKVAEKDNRVIITVIDKETDKVIRQIPPEDVLSIAESIEQGMESLEGGAILNSKA